MTKVAKIVDPEGYLLFSASGLTGMAFVRMRSVRIIMAFYLSFEAVFSTVKMILNAVFLRFFNFINVSPKYIVIGIVSICFLFSLVVIGMSFGLYLTIFSIVLIPAIILHIYAGIKAWKKHPQYVSWILLSTFAFLGFSLLRPDADQHGAFSGWSCLMYYLGVADTQHAEPWTYSLEVSLLLILAQIFINTYILRGLGKIPR